MKQTAMNMTQQRNAEELRSILWCVFRFVRSPAELRAQSENKSTQANKAKRKEGGPPFKPSTLNTM